MTDLLVKIEHHQIKKNIKKHNATCNKVSLSLDLLSLHAYISSWHNFATLAQHSFGTALRPTQPCTLT